MYKCETKGVIIRVEPDYLETESEPDEGRYVWSYTVEIENHSAAPVQIMTREWHITDSRGRTRIVRGDGVVGEQPVIEPGASFRYTSGAPLPTPSGFMSGLYGMRGPDGEVFDAPVPAFALDTPYMPATRH